MHALAQFFDFGWTLGRSGNCRGRRGRGLLVALHWGFLFVMLLAAVRGLDTTWSPWVVRGLALLATFVALWRLAVTVEYVATAPKPPAPASS